MKKAFCIIGILIIVLCSLTGAWADDIKVIMDYYPPFSYEENGEIKGVSTLIVRAALKEAGIETTITQYPFTRAYQMTQQGENIFEYCVVRTPEREKLFQWVGVVGPAYQSLFSLKDRNIKIEKIEDLSPYTIGTVFDDVVDQHLRKFEQQYKLKLDRVADYELNVNKLFLKRVDLCGINELVGLYLAQKLGHSEQDMKVVHTFEELTGEYFLVTGLKTPAPMVEKMRAALQKVHDNGTYKKILDEYFAK